MNQVEIIRKRNGTLVPFDLSKVEKAVLKAMQASNSGRAKEAKLVANEVKGQLRSFKREMRSFIPDVEGVQDIVERTLIYERFGEAAKAYILYRDKRNRLRQRIGSVSEKYKKLAKESRQYFASVYSELVFLRTYARWIPEEGRRETWVECVDRFINFMRSEAGNKLTEAEYSEVRKAILHQEVLPYL